MDLDSMNQERAMRLIVALLKITGPFEVSREVIDNPESYSGMVIEMEVSNGRR